MGAFEQVIHSLRKYADFKGRASRAEFWIFFGFVIIAGAAARLVDALLGAMSYLPGPVALVTAVLLFVPQLSVAIRRLHDVNRSGRALVAPCAMLVAAPIVALFGSFLGRIVALGFAAVTLLLFGQLLLMLARKGSSIPNRYGPSPTAFSFAK